MNMIEFTATEIGYLEDLGVVSCGASNADSPEEYHYVNFQRPVEIGSMDDEGVYFEMDDQSQGGYNIIEACKVEGNKLTITLVEPLSSGGTTVTVHFTSYASSGLRPINEGLRKIFVGYERLLQLNT